jgi:hypothetical protein
VNCRVVDGFDSDGADRSCGTLTLIHIIRCIPLEPGSLTGNAAAISWIECGPTCLKGGKSCTKRALPLATTIDGAY